MITYKCKECNQTSFLQLKNYGDKKSICINCIKKIERESIPLIKIEIEHEGFYVPVEDNLDYFDLYRGENINDLCKTFHKFFRDQRYLHGKLDINIIATNNVKEKIRPEKLKKITQCREFDFYIYDSFAIEGNLYDTPRNLISNGAKFSCLFALDCYEGYIYSKDFGYFFCEGCQRTICKQNPRNGWHGQYRIINDCEAICASCYQKRILEKGIDINDVIENETIPGDFLEDSDLIQHGFTIDKDFTIGYGRISTTYHSRELCLDYIKKLDRQGFYIAIQYDSIAIGGLGGEITLWIKPKSEGLKNVI